MQYNFLPYWYKQNEKRKKNLFGLTIIIILTIVNICLLYNVCDICKNIANIKASEINIICMNKEFSHKKIRNKEPLTYKNFETFLKFKSDYENICNIKVDSKRLSVRFKVKDMIQYENLVKKIESDSKYRILNLEAPKNSSDGDKFFQVDIEVM